MLDNRNSGLDPSFIDQAWEDMRKQLDVAMPVTPERNRRVLIWWWWAAALFLLFAVGIGWLIRPQATNVQALPIPMQQSPVATAQEIPNTITEAAPSSSPSQHSSQRRVTTANTPHPALSPTKMDNQEKGEESGSSKKTTTALMGDETKRQESVPPLVETSSTVDKEQEEIAPKETIQATPQTPLQRETVASFAALPGISTPSLPRLPLSFDQKVRTRRNSSHYTLEVGTSSRSFSSFDGYAIGLSKIWQKRASRWSFGVGLQYRQQLIPFSNEDLPKVGAGRATVSMDSPVTEESLGSNTVFNFSTGIARFAYGDSTISIPIANLNLVQRLHYMELPLYANYRLGRKWEASATLRFSYLARAYLDHTTQRNQNESADFALGNNQGGTNFDPSVGFYRFNQQSSTRIIRNTGDFHSTMLSGALGITYYPIPKLGWRVQYSSTPVSLYKLASIDRKDHWLGTSLIWRFGGR